MAVQLGESFPLRPPRPYAPRIRLPSLAHLPVDYHGRSTVSIDNLNMNETGLGGCGGPFPRPPPRRLPSAFPTSESSLAYCLVPLPPPTYRGRRGRPLAPSPGAATTPPGPARHHSVPCHSVPCGGAQNFSSTDCQYTRRHTGHLPCKMPESSAGRGVGPILGAYCTVRPESGKAGSPPLVPPAPRRAMPALSRRIAVPMLHRLPSHNLNGTPTIAAPAGLSFRVSSGWPANRRAAGLLAPVPGPHHDF